MSSSIIWVVIAIIMKLLYSCNIRSHENNRVCTYSCFWCHLSFGLMGKIVPSQSWKLPPVKGQRLLHVYCVYYTQTVMVKIVFDFVNLGACSLTIFKQLPRFVKNFYWLRADKSGDLGTFGNRKIEVTIQLYLWADYAPFE